MSKISNQFKKNWKIVVATLLILLISFGILAYFPFLNDKPSQRIIYEYDNLGTFSNDKITPIIGGFNASYGNKNYKIVQTKFDFLKPTYSLISQLKDIQNEPSESQYIEVKVIYLEKSGLQDWKISDFRSNVVQGISFSEVIDLASKYDITTDFPGKSNYKITNYPPLTPSEIQVNREFRQKQIDAEQYRKDNNIPEPPTFTEEELLKQLLELQEQEKLKKSSSSVGKE